MKSYRMLVFSVFLAFFSVPFSVSPGAARGKDLPAIFEEIELNGADSSVTRELESYIESNPRSASTDEALLKLGRIHEDQKDYTKAAVAFQKLIEGFPESRFRPEALYEIGFLKFKAGRINDAKAVLEAVSSGRESSLALKAKAGILLKEINYVSGGGGASGSEAPAIGVLLPMKGGFSQFGEDALSGVLLAADVFGGKNGGVEVIVRNADSDPASIDKALNEFASNPKVLGIVGPLLSATAGEAAKQAEEKKVPSVTLSQKEGISDGNYVFRNSLTPLQQTVSIAEYSVKKLGHNRFAVLYPKNNYGTELAKTFEMEIKKLGGVIVREESYEQGTTDFSSGIKHIFGVQAKEHKEGRRKIREYIPTAEVDALYIPDTYETVNLIAPYLGYFNVKGVQLLGSNGWNSPKLVNPDKNLEGAVFVDGFFTGSTMPASEDFTRRFRLTYGRDPGVLEAQAYDAAMIFISSISSVTSAGGRADREYLRARLKTLAEFKGATGTFSFDKRGEPVKKVFILTIRDGRVSEVPGS